jgi:hypothetical protein
VGLQVAAVECCDPDPSRRHSVSSTTEEQTMTGKADFTEQEWALVLEGPPSAGMIVLTAQRGGTIRETFAIAKA